MKRTLLAGIALALMVSAAQAASFGGPSVSSGGSSKSEADAPHLLAVFHSIILDKMNGEATGATAKSKDRPKAEAECPEAKKAEEDKQAQAKLQAGPEPVYLAF
jgi:hypothetical protein